jgi:hypothetical protein
MLRSSWATMIEASCHCGAVRLVCETAPTEITDCNCSVCRRYGVLWAYYSPTQVTQVPASALSDIYMWDDRVIRFHRCRTCGCVTHWSPVDPSLGRMRVNARLMPPAEIAGVRVRKLDGAGSEEYLDA